MPVAIGIGIALFGEAGFVIFLWFARIVTLAALNYALQQALPPLISRAFQGITNALVRHIERPLAGWLDDHLRPFTAWLVAWRILLTDSWGAIAPFAGRVASAFENLVDNTIPAIIAARVAPLARSIGRLDLLLTGTLVGGTLGIIPSLNHLYDRLFDRQTGELAILARGIDRLRSRLYDETAGDIHILARGIDRLRHDVFDPASGLAHNLSNRIGALTDAVFDDVTGAIPRVRADLGALRGEWDVVKPWLRTVTEAVGAGVAVEAFRRMVRCGSKIDKLCTTDEDILGDLLGTLLVIGAFDGLEAFTREAADVLGSSLDAVKSLAD